MVVKPSFQPIIKWSGSKRSQANTLVKYFPDFNRYYEPFLGGGSVMYVVNPSFGIGGDVCEPLIDLWNLIKTNPLSLIESYERDWTRLQEEGHLVFYEIRDRFNETQNPLDLFFLSRTCVNGLIRFNKEGKFNNSLHHTRKGIDPKRLKGIITIWANKIQNVDFRKGDYRQTTEDISDRDFVYLDPPYFNTRGRYFGTIDYDEFLTYLETLNRRNIKFALSFDGKREDRDYLIEIPTELYKRHVLIQSGNSSFKKVMDKRNEMVFESLYLNW